MDHGYQDRVSLAIARRIASELHHRPDWITLARDNLHRWRVANVNAQLEHVLRAAAGITGADEFVVFGSQAIHGQISNPPAELLLSIEVD